MIAALTFLALASPWPQAEEIAATAVSDAPAQKVETAPLQPNFTSAYERIAMMPLSSLGSTDEVKQAIERVLVAEFKQLLGDRLITPNDLMARGELAGDAFMECEGVVVCLVEVVGGLGWDAFLVGNIAGLGEDRVINLKLIDVRTGGEVRRAQEKASGDEATLIKRMRTAAVTLLAPELLVGTVDLLVAQPEVEIIVDGLSLGKTPLQSNRVELPVGRHAIEATGEGLVPFSTLVDIAYGENKKVTISLPRNTVFVGGDTPFRSRWYTWAAGGVGLLAAGLGGYFHYLHRDDSQKIEDRAKNGTLTVDHAEPLYESYEDNLTRARVFYGIGGALLGTVGVLLVFDFM